jgi:hypothetical protein
MKLPIEHVGSRTGSKIAQPTIAHAGTAVPAPARASEQTDGTVGGNREITRVLAAGSCYSESSLGRGLYMPRTGFGEWRSR